MTTEATTVQITMPAMGESVTEGTVLEWLKQVGDRVEADEPLVEISTDKVDGELPAPAAGTLTKANPRLRPATQANPRLRPTTQANPRLRPRKAATASSWT